MVKKHRITIMLDGENLARVDEIKQRLHLSRSQVIDRFVSDGLAAEKFGQQLLFNPKGARDMLQEIVQGALVRASKEVSKAVQKDKEAAAVSRRKRKGVKR